MTLRELLAAHPDKFYPQTWYRDEAFMDIPCSIASGFPVHYISNGMLATPQIKLAPAAPLAYLWCYADRTHPMWAHYLWTCDVDHLGQRVYVGQNGHGLEIHRHIHITSRFVSPLW